SASLVATAVVRLARVVDRIRRLAEQREVPRDAGHIGRHERRALLAERAVSFYFLAIVFFVVAGFAIPIDHATGDRLSWFPVMMTTLGMALIVGGSAAMLAECRLALTQIRAEISALRV